MFCLRKPVFIFTFIIIFMFSFEHKVMASTSIIPTNTIISPAPANTEVFGTLQTLLFRVTAGEARLEDIYTKITTRFQKLNIPISQTKIASKYKNIIASYNQLVKQIDTLKTELTKISNYQQQYIASPTNANYQILRKEIVSTDTLMKKTLDTEKLLLKSAKQFSISPTATPTSVLKITVTPRVK